MQKNQAYHEAAIAYNEGLADAAEELAETLGHEEPQRWCRAVAKQHRFHAKRHRSALEKLLASESSDEEVEKVDVEQIPDGLDLPETVVETPVATNVSLEQPFMPPVVEANQSDELQFEEVVDDKDEAGDVNATPVEIIEEAPVADDVMEDGCVGYHNPMDPNCAYSPQTRGSNG